MLAIRRTQSVRVPGRRCDMSLYAHTPDDPVIRFRGRELQSVHVSIHSLCAYVGSFTAAEDWRTIEASLSHSPVMLVGSHGSDGVSKEDNLHELCTVGEWPDRVSQVDSDDQYISDARSVRGLTLALVFMCMLTVTQMMQARAAGQSACAGILMPQVDAASKQCDANGVLSLIGAVGMLSSTWVTRWLPFGRSYCCLCFVTWYYGLRRRSRVVALYATQATACAPWCCTTVLCDVSSAL